MPQEVRRRARGRVRLPAQQACARPARCGMDVRPGPLGCKGMQRMLRLSQQVVVEAPQIFFTKHQCNLQCCEVHFCPDRPGGRTTSKRLTPGSSTGLAQEATACRGHRPGDCGQIPTQNPPYSDGADPRDPLAPTHSRREPGQAREAPASCSA